MKPPRPGRLTTESTGGLVSVMLFKGIGYFGRVDYDEKRLDARLLFRPTARSAKTSCSRRIV